MSNILLWSDLYNKYTLYVVSIAVEVIRVRNFDLQMELIIKCFVSIHFVVLNFTLLL